MTESSDPPPPATESAAPNSALPDRFELEGFDEVQAPGGGRIFAEPPPEPPLKPYERLHEKIAAKRGAPGGGGTLASIQPSLRARLFWGTLPLALLLAGYASVIGTQRGVGFAWDEAYYYQPSLRAGDWITEILKGNRPFGAKAIGEYWGADTHNEHPSMQKLLSGMTLRFFKDPAAQYYAMRLPMALLFGMTLMFIYWMGRRTWGPAPGLIAALIYATMPRIFGHAHFASLETPLIFFTVLTVFCFLRGLESPLWAAITGVVFGLLLATKINGFFLPIPLVLWGHLYARRKYVNNLFAMLTLGPMTMIAAWPWLWHDTANHLLDYWRFHAQHQMTALFFEGRKWGYGGVNAPWYYPLAMIGVTLPLVSLALVVWGTLRTLLHANVRPLGGLFVLCAAAPLAVACLPGTPRYDGERLFLNAFPFLALMGASGTVGLMRRIEHFLAGRPDATEAKLRSARRWTVTATALAVLGEGMIAIGLYHPYLLSYFNPLVGGIAGAERRGFEVAYWGDALNQSVITALNSLPPGSRVKPLALNELTLQQLQDFGIIDSKIKIGGAQGPFDYHLLQMRRGMFARPEFALASSRRFLAQDKWGADKWGLDGVTLMALYKTGPEFEAYWPTLPPPPVSGAPVAR